MAEKHPPRKRQTSQSTVVGVRMPLSLLRALKVMAQADDRTVSGLIHKLLRDHIERQPKGK